MHLQSSRLPIDRQVVVIFKKEMYLVWDAVTRYHRMGDLNNRNLFPVILKARKSKIKVPADLVSGKGTSWFANSHLVVYPHGGITDRGSKLSCPFL